MLIILVFVPFITKRKNSHFHSRSRDPTSISGRDYFSPQNYTFLFKTN